MNTSTTNIIPVFVELSPIEESPTVNGRNNINVELIEIRGKNDGPPQPTRRDSQDIQYESFILNCNITSIFPSKEKT